MKVPVAMAERQDALGGLTDVGRHRQNLVPRLGVLGLTVDAPVAEVLPACGCASGVVVVSTVEGAIDARDGGLAPGDVIFTLNRTLIADWCNCERRSNA